MLPEPMVFFDVETTGLVSAYEAVCEIGAVKIFNKKITGKFHTLVNPKRPIPYAVYLIHKISDEDVKDAPTFEEASDDFLRFIQGTTIFAYNAPFDLGFINWEMSRLKKPAITNPVIDVLALARAAVKLPRYKLACVAEHFKVTGNFHRGLADAIITSEIFFPLWEIAQSQNISLEQFNVNRNA